MELNVMIAIKTKRKRGGIILLVVLGVLALFSILAVTYLTFATNSRQAAFNTARREFHNPNPEFLMEEAVGQILRGTTDPSSALFRHDILGDYYGYQDLQMGVSDAFKESFGFQADPSPNRRAILVGENVVQVPISNYPTLIPNTIAGQVSPYNLDDAFAGRTVTFKEGPLTNTTVHCLRSAGYRDPNSPVAFERYSLYLDMDVAQLPRTVVLEDGSVVQTANLLSTNHPNGPSSPSPFFYSSSGPYDLVVNPIPRNGSGIYSTDTNQMIPLNLPVNERLSAALQPNHAAWWTDANAQILQGNADEPYDAPDLENMFLAFRGVNSFGNSVNIPSFHRPSLIRHLLSEFSGNPNRLWSSIRGGTLRPLPVIARDPNLPMLDPNSSFTGGNSDFNLRIPHNGTRAAQLAQTLIDGPWDVDNDGDNEKDSIWIDAKLPLVTGLDGTRLRPLIAVQIEDLSSKFNVNAHGSQAHLSSDFHFQFNGPYPFAERLPGQLTDPVSPVQLPAGRGHGPAEIVPLLTRNGINNQGRFPLTENGLLARTILEMVNSRYANAADTERAPGRLTNESVDVFNSPNQPQVHARNSVHGFPTDRHGRGILATDPSGNLISGYAGEPLRFDQWPLTIPRFPAADEVVNDPYEFSPSENLSGDSRFSLVDYERVLERNRWQQYLHPSRLEEAIGEILDLDSTVSRMITPISGADVRPPQQPPTELASNPNIKLDRQTGRPTLLVESLLARVIANPTASFGRPRNGSTAAIDERDVALANLLVAPELRKGGLLNINRPFGNGLDDNGNGIIDEPLESDIEGSYAGLNLRPQYNLSPVPPNLRPQILDQAGNRVPLPESPREAMARHLYCLVMLLMNDNPDQKRNWVGQEFQGDLDRYIARRVAQWAVNVVDYRDSDSIMTRFVYDFNPLNGWNTNVLNNDPSNPPEFAEVWGCEHPELLFMESLAFHDVRVKDTNVDSEGDLIDDGDANTDQIRIPQGSAFLELYNPRPRTTVSQANHEALPAELYDFSGPAPALDLGQFAPRTPAAGQADRRMPVWRIAISEPHIIMTPEHELNPIRLQENYPDIASFEFASSLPNDPSEELIELALERFVIFARPLNQLHRENIETAFGISDQHALFENLTNNSADAALLLPSTYLTIAPRTVTHLGSLADGGIPLGPSNQRFEAVLNRGMFHYNHNISDVSTTPRTISENSGEEHEIQDNKVFIAQTFTPLAWNITPRERGQIFGPNDFGIGFNISEPLPSVGLTYYRKPSDFLLGETGAFPRRDAYWDYSSGMSSGDAPATRPADLTDGFPIRIITDSLSNLPPGDEPSEPFLGYVPQYRTAFLQRLANPLLAFQDDPNSPNYNPYRTIDWISMDLDVFSGDESPRKIVGEGNQLPEYSSKSVQRTGVNRDLSPNQLLFSNRLNDGARATSRPVPSPIINSPYFNLSLEADYQSLGYLNEYLSKPTPTAPMGRISRANAGGFLSYVGQPAQPFIQHPWMNRPFSSPLELMLVPATSQGRLFEEFGVAKNSTPYRANDDESFRAPFEHLLNFFDGAETTAISESGVAVHAHLYRIFEYLTTGPKFAGETKPKPPAWSNVNSFWAESYRFPFNTPVSTGETGRINLNTISNSKVFDGLMWNHLSVAERQSSVGFGASPLWGDFLNTRRNATVPWTQFPQPFTSSMSDSIIAPLQTNPGVNGTILAEGSNNNVAFFSRTGEGRHDHPTSNALLAYQRLMRMSNLTTNNSNTFVIRITMGFFEFNEATGLGKEHMADYGRNKRYRATYVIDRSIPVNYETGVDNDTRNCILFERFYRD